MNKIVHKNFFKHTLKKFLPLTLVVTLIFALAHILEITVFDHITYYYQLDRHWYQPSLEILLYMVSIFALLFPSILYQYKFRRRSEDIYYSLPITRKSLALTTYLSGLVLISGCYFLCFFIGMLVSMTQTVEFIHYGYYALFFLPALALVILYYTLGTAVALASRNRMEAAFLTVCVQLIPFILYPVTLINGGTGMAVPVLAVSYLVSVFSPGIGHWMQYVSTGSGNYYYEDLGRGQMSNGSIFFLPALILLVLLALLVIPAILILIDRQKSEDTGLPDNSFTGSRLFLPLVFASAALLLGSSINSFYIQDLFYIFLVVALYIILDMVRRRKVKFTLEMGINIGIFVMIGLLSGFIL